MTTTHIPSSASTNASAQQQPAYGGYQPQPGFAVHPQPPQGYPGHPQAPLPQQQPGLSGYLNKAGAAVAGLVAGTGAAGLLGSLTGRKTPVSSAPQRL